MTIKRSRKESNKYDWIPGRQGQMLIYTGRKPNPKVEPGIMRMNVGTPQDSLYLLLKAGKLEGQALEDAIKLWPTP